MLEHQVNVNLAHEIDAEDLANGIQWEALERAIQDDFTISSTTHNKGKGLSNILSCSDVVRIFSGNALLLKTSDQLKIFEVGFYYPGTLIYFDKNLNDLEDIDILDDFNW